MQEETIQLNIQLIRCSYRCGFDSLAP